MTETAPGKPSAEDLRDLLGLVAYTQLAVFGRLAADAAQSPSLAARQRISVLAASVLGRQAKVLDRIGTPGAAQARMAVFDGAYDDFDARTVPGGWWEGVLKGYVGHGVAEDFCRLIAQGLATEDREFVVDALALGREADESVAAIVEAAAGDAVLASRLALWGRRLVGEALNAVQALLADHPSVARLVAAGAEGGAAKAGSVAGSQAWVFAQLTAEHTRRMGRLGLAA